MMLVFLSPVTAELFGNIHVRSNPDAARVYLDDTPVGTTPLELTGISPGRYRLRVEYRGYKPRSEWILVEAGRTSVFTADLARFLGVLEVHTDTPGVEILLHDRWVAAHSIDMPPGFHSVRFRAFGFEEESREVRITEGETSTVSLSLRPATLGPPSIEVRPVRFHPESVGTAGKVRATVQVNAPAFMEVQILDDREESVAEFTYTLEDRETVWSWDGRTSTGDSFPPGEYRILFTVTDDSTYYLLSRTVTIDRSAMIQPGITGAYGRGTTLVPRLEQRNRDSFSFQFSGGSIFREEPPLFLELAFELVPIDGLSASARATAAGDATWERPRFDLGGNVTYPLLSATPPFLAGIRIGGHGGSGARHGPERSAVEFGVPMMIESASSSMGLLVEPGLGFFDRGGGGAGPDTPGGFIAAGFYWRNPRLLTAFSSRITGDSALRTARHAFDMVIDAPGTPLSGRVTVHLTQAGAPWNTDETEALLLLGLGLIR